MGKHLTKLSHLDFDRAPGRLTMLSLTASEALESRIFSGEPPRNQGGITKFPKIAIIILYWVSSETSRCARQEFFIFLIFRPHLSPEGPSEGSQRPLKTDISRSETNPTMWGIIRSVSMRLLQFFIFF